MQPLKSILIWMGILGLLFVFIGCSSNPMTSTQTVPIADNPDTGSDSTGEEPEEDNPGNSGGISTTPNTDIPKYDQGDDDDVFPTPPN